MLFKTERFQTLSEERKIRTVELFADSARKARKLGNHDQREGPGSKCFPSLVFQDGVKFPVII